jgi:NAD-dependent SIR2 family protein deacetylase
MYSKTQISQSINDCSAQTERLKQALAQADAVVIGAGAGLSASAGFAYAGERFERNFADFIAKYHLTDMYTAGFYPFPTPEEKWAYWSRHIWYNRYVPAPKPVYGDLLKLVRNKDYFVLTTNVDHQFQKAGFDKRRLFYTQGDYGLWQCSEPCHLKTYDNADIVRQMLAEQKDLRIPTELVPRCPVCGRPMSMNLRADDTFVEDAGWREAQSRYHAFLNAHGRGRVVYLELGVGYNTPGIIKIPFWRLTLKNPEARFFSVNAQISEVPVELAAQSVRITADIGNALRAIL